MRPWPRHWLMRDVHGELLRATNINISFKTRPILTVLAPFDSAELTLQITWLSRWESALFDGGKMDVDMGQHLQLAERTGHIACKLVTQRLNQPYSKNCGYTPGIIHVKPHRSMASSHTITSRSSRHSPRQLSRELYVTMLMMVASWMRPFHEVFTFHFTGVLKPEDLRWEERVPSG